MRKLINYVIIAIIMVLMVIPVSTLAKTSINIPIETTEFYVNDFANIFSNVEKARIMKNASDLCIYNNGIQIVITTVEEIQGTPIESYATEMYSQYKIGKDEKGILILFSKADEKLYVKIGKGMDPYATEAQVNKLIDSYTKKAFEQSQYSRGMVELQEAIINEIQTNIQAIEDENKTQDDPGVAVVIILVTAALAMFVANTKLFDENQKNERRID